MIPAEAVEAAISALGERYGEDAYCKDREYVTTTLEAAAEHLNWHSPPKQSAPLVKALRDRVEAVKKDRGQVPLSSIAGALEALPNLMKARREHLGLSMLAVAKAVDVPMMTYRRFELGDRDRLRIPHIVRMLRWLETP